MFSILSRRVTEGRPIRLVAAAASAILILGVLEGCTAAQPSRCSLDVVNETLSQAGAGHDAPESSAAFSRQFLTDGLTVLCAGDYQVNFTGGANDPRPVSVAIVTGSDPTSTVKAAVPGAKGLAGEDGYSEFDKGADTIKVIKVKLSHLSEQTYWAIEYIKDHNK